MVSATKFPDTASIRRKMPCMMNSDILDVEGGIVEVVEESLGVASPSDGTWGGWFDVGIDAYDESSATSVPVAEYIDVNAGMFVYMYTFTYLYTPTTSEPVQ